MNTKEVTVYNRVPVTMTISVQQVIKYLERTGWKYHYTDDSSFSYDISYWRKDDLEFDLALDEPANFYIEVLADLENRQPGDILVEIAQEPLI